MWVCFIPTHLKKTSLFVSWRAFGQLETPHLSLITNDDDELVSGLTTVCSSLLLQYIWAVFTHRLRPKETLSHEIISRTSGTVKPDQIMMCFVCFSFCCFSYYPVCHLVLLRCHSPYLNLLWERFHTKQTQLEQFYQIQSLRGLDFNRSYYDNFFTSLHTWAGKKYLLSMCFNSLGLMGRSSHSELKVQ